MKKIIEIIRKNALTLTRSKKSALIIILGPLLIMLLAGLAFDNSNKYQVNIGAYSESYNELTESFLTRLKDSKFYVEKTETQEECLDKVKESINHVCIEFPPDMSISEGALSNEIIFNVDYSRINLVWAIRDIVLENIESRSKELSTDLAESILQKLKDAQAEIRDQKPIVVQFTDDYLTISKEIEFIKKNLDDLSLGLSTDDFRAEAIKSESDLLSELALQTLNNSERSLLEIRQNLSIMPNTSDINSLILRIDSELALINSTKRNISERNINFKEAVSSINASVDMAVEKLDSVSLARKEINSRIDSIKERAASSLKSIANMQNSLNKIDTGVETIKANDAASIVNPIKTTVKPIAGEKSYINYIFPGLIVLIIMLVSIILASTFVMAEKKSRAYFRNFITPTSDLTFFAGTMASAILMMLIQITVIILATMVFFASQMIPNLMTTFLVLILVTIFFVAIGMAIGHIFNSETTSMLGAVSISMLFLILSGLIIPIESMPIYLAKIIKSNPFIISESLIKKTMLYGQNISQLGNEFSLLLIYIATFTIAALLIQQFTKRNMAKRIDPLFSTGNRQLAEEGGKKRQKGRKKTEKANEEQAMKEAEEFLGIKEGKKAKKKNK